MDTYLVEYRDRDGLPRPFSYFVCEADDKAHAVEQCQNAYPDDEIGDVGLVVWLNK